MFRKSYGEVFEGDERWNSLEIPTGDRFAWPDESTYVRQPPYFEGMPPEPEPLSDIDGARVLAKLGDSVTTDHISPAGSIKKDGPAGAYLIEHGVEPREFNSYGSRRGNHEVMMRGTFANIRLRNQLAPGDRGRRDALPRRRLRRGDVDLRRGDEVRGGRARRSSSSAARSTARGRRATGRRRARTCSASARSSRRASSASTARTSSGWGSLPLQFPEGESAESLGLTGEEEFSITGLAEPLNAGDVPRTVNVKAGNVEFEARVRIDTPKEAEYFRHGGILQYVLRSLIAS